MILLTAVAAGILTGWVYARYKGRTWHVPVFRSVWLVIIGFLPQYLAFYMPYTRKFLSDEVASACLVWSQVILLVFTLINYRLPGMLILTLGLACNLGAILANGGFMPLTFDAAARLVSQSVLGGLTIGARIGSASKDILLQESQIVLPWLADRFVPPTILSYRFAFSIGDVFVAAGAFWMLFTGQQPAASISTSGVI